MDIIDKDRNHIFFNPHNIHILDQQEQKSKGKSIHKEQIVIIFFSIFKDEMKS